MDPQLRARIADTVGAVATVRRVSGGDFADAYAVELVDGGRVFAKTHRRPPPEFFSTEAAGLTWLREAEALSVPQVLAVFDDASAGLILEWVFVRRRFRGGHLGLRLGLCVGFGFRNQRIRLFPRQHALLDQRVDQVHDGVLELEQRLGLCCVGGDR